MVLELVGFSDRLAEADLVVTGEGTLDEQTLQGKAPAGVAAAAVAAAIPVVAVCGRNQLDTESLRSAGIIAAYALTDLEPDVQKCIAEPAPLLVRLGEQMTTDHLSCRTKASRADSGEGDGSVGRPIQDRVRR